MKINWQRTFICVFEGGTGRQHDRVESCSCTGSHGVMEGGVCVCALAHTQCIESKKEAIFSSKDCYKYILNN